MVRIIDALLFIMVELSYYSLIGKKNCVIEKLNENSLYGIFIIHNTNIELSKNRSNILLCNYCL
jgi:hypothetical protein